ncbi:transposase [Oxalobacteraceae bacterium GrIS 2.11]
MSSPNLTHLPPEVQAYFHDLESRLAERNDLVSRYQKNIIELKLRIDQLEEQFRLAQLKRYAPSSEKFGVQGCLFNEAETAGSDSDEPACDEDAPAQDNDQHSNDTPAPGKKRGRKKLPAHLKRERIEHDLPEADKHCACCQGALHRMGEEVSEQLHIVPAQVSVVQHVRFKYACRHCEQHGTSGTIVTAQLPAQPIPGSIASAATIATLMTAKYADGLPLYRLESVLDRSDIHLGRGTMGRWFIRSSEDWLSRIYDALHQILLRQTMIHGDETRVQVLKENGKTAQSTSYMWVYRSAQHCDEPVVLFDYQPGRGHEHPQRFLQGYRGSIMTDGYAAWRMQKDVTHLGCLAHLRRKFDEALKAQKNPTGRAKHALEAIAQLYRVEKQAQEKPPEGITRTEHVYALRQTKSRPILDALQVWLIRNKEEVLPQSLIGKAINYAQGQWKYITRYIEDGDAAIDNNVIERDIRPFVTGRKSWLFSDTVAGARASATIYSLMLTCRACDVEPYSYLLHVLTELPSRASDADVTDLLPFNFKKITADTNT